MANQPEVKKEKSGWRDERISAWHRTLGWDQPSMDIDYLSVEFTNFQPACFFEYKHENSKFKNTNQPSVKVLINLGNNSKCPSFVVIYKDDLKEFILIPLNDFARNIYKDDTKLTEEEFRKFHSDVRKNKLMKEILED